MSQDRAPQTLAAIDHYQQALGHPQTTFEEGPQERPAGRVVLDAGLAVARPRGGWT
ncbi:MAG: hypothetical protein RDU83_13720 [bacterium]|nr:hypothetical protein [bacterium]